MPRLVLSPAVAEAFVLLNFAVLIAGLVLIPLLRPSALSLFGLGIGLTLNVVIAFAYAVLIVRFEPPLGKHIIYFFMDRPGRASETYST